MCKTVFKDVNQTTGYYALGIHVFIMKVNWQENPVLCK